MDRLREAQRRIFGSDDPEGVDASYQPLEGGSEGLDGEPIEHPSQQEFSWIDYSIFMLLGIAMLWAW
jgi:equilibrative nucleoside transporter 1/2/3